MAPTTITYLLIFGLKASEKNSCIHRNIFNDLYKSDLFPDSNPDLDRISKSSFNKRIMKGYKYKGKAIASKLYVSLLPRDREEAFNEAFFLYKAQNISNIVKFYFCAFDNKSIEIFLERLKGDFVSKTEDFFARKWRTKIRIISELSYSFSQLHVLKIIHGDIKPDNLGLSTDLNKAKIFDLGFSNWIGGFIYGYTARYVSPERVLEPHDYIANTKKDVWSWLVTIITLLFPYEAQNLYKTFLGKYSTFMNFQYIQALHKEITLINNPKYIPLILKLREWLRTEPAGRPEMFEIHNYLESYLKELEEKKEKIRLNKLFSPINQHFNKIINVPPKTF